MKLYDETFDEPARQAGVDHSLRAGAKALKDTLQAITDLSNQTCCQLGDDVDSRDYVTMTNIVESSIRTNLIDAPPEHRQGYLRALVDLLGLVGDDCGLPRPWDPIASTESAFTRHRMKAGDQGRPAS